MEKTAYISPPTGALEINVVRDARPQVTITLDLGIPNFTVFSLKMPLVEDQPKSMSGLIAEAVHALLDEVSTFMLSLEYEEDVIVLMYATVLACFKGMSQETNTDKGHSEIGQDNTVKTFQGTFKLPQVFVNETQAKVITAASKIERAPKQRHLELTTVKPQKTTVNDAARVIREYRNRTIKTQSRPMFVIVYDQMGRASGTLPLGTNFKNKLLQMMKQGSLEFTNPVTLNEHEMKYTNVTGIPSAITVEGETFKPSASAGTDMALYKGMDNWLVKFNDGRTVMFPGRPSIRTLRHLNYPVPSNRFRWTLVREEQMPPEPQQQEEEAPPQEEAPQPEELKAAAGEEDPKAVFEAKAERLARILFGERTPDEWDKLNPRVRVAWIRSAKWRLRNQPDVAEAYLNGDNKKTAIKVPNYSGKGEIDIGEPEDDYERVCIEIANDDNMYGHIVHYVSGNPDGFDDYPEDTKKLMALLSKLPPLLPRVSRADKCLYRGEPETSHGTVGARGIKSWSINYDTAEYFARECRGVVKKTVGPIQGVALEDIVLWRNRLRQRESNYSGSQAEWFVLDNCKTEIVEEAPEGYPPSRY